VKRKTGETYYWNEFNLEADGGGNADLVYEEADTRRMAAVHDVRAGMPDIRC